MIRQLKINIGRIFFFSSRRRHTMCGRDWSSDVCSSDLAKPVPRGHRGHKKGVSGQAIFEPLRKAAYRVGAKIQTQSKVVGLITDTDKNIIGVKAIQLRSEERRVGKECG